mmetsp:Transcript_12659/g.18275  ORF Transcript_12659/g.18275 Transcript_12659/m.18275 type:complete len:587 (+) Transcript_12659:45-1805(+)|eukprot:CAMPEP_0195521744 /NCGR_PEP_ID=MMETSP0794_2-20130614/19269_1 /TAXON_ID=515487 /ORGANISM="Stephanopyxis turris, Strain CCMP 815" /LENGTH=586 /DNA_ID=CAMNT_0040651363 /DNA_START=38 /DNA_END=1798 /DNA_ORIENTATION=-
MTDETPKTAPTEPNVEPPPKKACPLQVVSIGSAADEYAFTYHEQELQSVLQKIPPEHKVAVVSVVGAFRTGKSFLLSWFLRYLDYHHGDSENGEFPPDLVSDNEGDGKEGQDATCKQWYEMLSTVQGGFDWRGGSERTTQGIWVWSEPFTVPINANREGNVSGKQNEDNTEKKGNEKEDISVILVDTQGMFDHETTMKLTAAIFGLSTLFSSYQIYNVDKRIQEDNLQQLALFSEYGKMALGKKPDMSEEKNIEPATGTDEADAGMIKEEDDERKPFQKIEFLVRDWQNFEDDEDEDLMDKEMNEYLDTVLKERSAQDLKDTRDQINNCFEKVACYLLTHPGFAVTKKKYTGDVKSIEPTFLMLLNKYCHRVFAKDLEPKIIHGRELTASELGNYMKAYAGMFESGAHFPEAATMLEATASANNSNATAIAITKYKAEMDALAGPNATNYVKPKEFEEVSRRLLMSSLELFDSMADFGSKKSIANAREKVWVEATASLELYTKLNESRNPLMGFELFIVPMVIAMVSLVMRWIADSTCSSWSTTCRASSDILSQVYTVIFIFIMIVASTKAKLIGEKASTLKKLLT